MSSPNEIDERLLDRFFERQRREVLQRIRRQQASRRTRVSIAAIAAALLLFAMSSAIVLNRGPQTQPGPQTVSLWELPAITVPPGDDPLAVFGSWDDERRPEFLEALAIPDLGFGADGSLLAPFAPDLDEFAAPPPPEGDMRG